MSENEPKADEIMTTEQAAALVAISRRKMGHAIASGAVDGTPRPNNGGSAGYRVLRSHVIAWVGRGMPGPQTVAESLKLKKPEPSVLVKARTHVPVAPKAARAKRKAAKVKR